jgi:serine-protein kinase ATM
VRIERTSYLSTSKSSRSSITAKRLRECAFVFRLAVELGVRKITSKTANAVIDHVVDTLPVAADAPSQPLTDDYSRSLRAVLDHAPHVEHLRDKKWHTLAEFLIQGISRYAPEEAPPSSGMNTSMLSQHSRNGHATSFRVSQSSGSYATRNEAGRPAEDLFWCLERLTSATNAPIISIAADIIECITRFLNSSSSSSLHQIAFSCLNSITARAITEDSRLAQRMILDIIPTIRRLWSSKSLLLRDEMLITLVLSRDIIKAMPQTHSNDDVYSSLNNLLEVISAEYSRRNERDVLQLDEIIFSSDPKQQVMSLDKFRIRAEHTRGTFNWATISVLACLTLTVDQLSHTKQDHNTNENPSKRLRLTNGVEDVFRQSLSATALSKVRALQTVPFLLNDCSAMSDVLPDLLAQYTNQILDEDHIIATWTMVAISRHACPICRVRKIVLLTMSHSFVSTQSTLKPELKPQWIQIWHRASRNLSNPNLSRPAAHLLNSILRSAVMQNIDVSKLIDATLFSDGLNGPVGMSDTALSLWSTIIDSRSAVGQSSPHQIVTRLVNWLSSHYTLGLSFMSLTFV